MDDSKHVLNVVFKTERKEIETVTRFQVYPIYWAYPIIYGSIYTGGRITIFATGRELVTGSVVMTATTSTSGIPSVNYSACAIMSGCTIFSASGILSSIAYPT